MSLAILILCCVWLVTANQEELSVDTTIALVVALQSYFQSGCLFLLYAADKNGPELKLEWQLVKIHYAFSNQQLPITSLPLTVLNSSNAHMHCFHNKPLFVVMPCANETLQLYETFAEQTWVSQSRWLLLPPAVPIVPAPFDCELLMTTQCGDSLCLSELFRVDPTLPVNSLQWGRWSPGQIMQGPTIRSLNRRRDNLQGAVIRLSVGNDEPYELVSKENNTTKVVGFMAKVWKELETRMNFTTELVVVEGNTGGSKQPNNSWSGQIGLILNGVVHASLNRITMTTSRMEAVDYTVPIIATKACTLIQTPDTYYFRWGIFMAPFSEGLWFSVIGSILVFVLLLTALLSLGQLCFMEGPRVYGLWDCVVAVWATYCAQVPDIAPCSWTGRLVYWVAGLTAVTLRAAYSANLIASLTSRLPKMPFTSLQGLMDDGTYGFGVVDRSGLYTDFMNASDCVMMQIFKQLIHPEGHSLPNDTLTGLQRVCNKDRYAFMAILDYILAYENNIDCHITILSQASFPLTMGLIFSKRNPFLRLINHNLMELRRTGLLQRNYIMQTNRTFDSVTSLTVSLPFAGVLPLLSVWTVGAILAILMCLFENWRRNLNQRGFRRVISLSASHTKVSSSDSVLLKHFRGK